MISEELYSVLGHLLAMIEPIAEEDFQKGTSANKAAFIRTQWAQFSVDCEQEYRQQRIEKTYDLPRFVEEVSERFKSILTAAAPAYVASQLDPGLILKQVRHRYTPPKIYHPYTRAVTRKDCTSSIELAYHLVNLNPPKAAKFDKKAIEKRVYQLLASVKTGQLVDQQLDYLQYLTTTSATQAEIRAIHQNCLRTFLAQQQEDQPWYKRWSGYERGLNKIADDQNYLLLFRALSSTGGKESLVELESVKQSIKVLLEDYRYRWFISPARRKCAANVITSISQANTMDELIQTLANQQTALAKKDIASNKTRYTSIHFFGKSRLQNSMTRALNLAVALHANTKVDLMYGLSQQLAEVSTMEQPFSLDEFKKAKNNAFKDKANAIVIATQLEASFARQRSGVFRSKRLEEETMTENEFGFNQ